MTAPTRRAPAKLPPVPESQVLRDCLAYLQLMGVFAWRQNTGVAMLKGRGGNLQPVKFGFSGVSDIIGMLPDGRFLAVECKRVGGVVSDAQRAFLDEVERRGGLAVVVHCVDELDTAIVRDAHGVKV